jgi:hypothetical protein
MRGRSLKLTLKSGIATLALLGAMALAQPAYANNDLPFTISVDGQEVDGSGKIVDKNKVADVAINGVDIQVKFDGLGVKPILNVSTFPIQVNFRSGETIRFLASFNYAAWIDRGEIIIYDRTGTDKSRHVAVIPIDATGAAEWQMPADAPVEMDYVLRVYDQQGRYDETRALPIKHGAAKLVNGREENAAVAPGYGEDRTEVRNISVFGGAITVYGKNVPEGHDVRVMGEPVPIDNHNNFVVQRVLPPGAHSVDVSVLQDGKGLNFTREIEVPEDEWFGVGLADLTVGHNFGNGIVEHTGVDEFPGTWTRGRAAFYLKGKIKGQYILTASADTGEGTLRDMFTGLDGKDPRTFLKRINPNDYYPVYGDDSTSYEDAPTRGKFYVRFEKGPSAIMWGNFKSNITGTHFMESSRALYGASGVYRSDAVNKNGDARIAADVYAAQPGTAPATDIFRGTGGSAYFLKHQDITSGSETITIEVRNAITGWVVDRKQLTNVTDYRFDQINGVLILNAPLASSTSAGYEQYVIAHYEYQPVASDLNGYVLGGRAQVWAGDHVRAGVTALREKQQTADQTVVGADLRVQSSKDTYVEAEVSHSEGPGFGSAYSIDGGLSLQNTGTAGAIGKPANAWRVETGVSLEELTHGGAKGHIGARIDHYEAGFSSPAVQASSETTKWGVDADVTVGEGVAVKGAYSESNVAASGISRQGDVRASVDVSEHVTVEPYAKYTEQTGTAVAATQNGTRGDVGTKIIYRWNEDTQAYVFGQATVAQTGTMLRDDRVGVGGKKKITDHITALGEVSQGTQGIDVTGAIDYAPTADDHYTLGYRRDAFRSSASSSPYSLTGDDFGTFTLGSRHRFNEQWMAYSENNFDFFGDRRTLTNTYGVEYTPTTEWKINGAVEIGRVIDNTLNSAGLKNPNLYREAGSLAATYNSKDGVDGKLKVELRHDTTDDGTSEVMAYLLQAGLGEKMSKDWRALANLDAVISDANTDVKDSAYVSGVVGFAYRPATNDRVNALLKYNFLYDNPGDGQVTVDGTTSNPAQISSIFSGDITYQATQQIAIGAKYGFRIGEIRDRTPGAAWVASQAHLGILRLDYHLVNEWSAVVEGRAMWSPETQQTDLGFVAAIYRELGDNFRMGIGYNFGDFSDELSHINHDNHGVFINLVGKF